ncbi:glycoside hydrolase family 15 protein [Arthrobacter sp. ES3-54]|uniref:glycoside hydrolase family 15 protein n=1 Tax=Arthrobacter sp. ES3-54 TaxID=1502991 RepID=UPI0024064316|nr:glycoside hydrolase family 15 protein [Arthrobacter sp. ES3-54]MDF9752075.1 GH15 family glucan-1,4-alpha-glucosidase [Arthrobacter sp. ES3-54]
MVRIEDYAMVGDLHTAALISTEGSIDWLCLPRFDSPACFSALLDTPAAGRWLLAPAAGGECTRRRYRKGTLILETEWDLPEGKVRIIDFMPPRDEVADIVRIVVGVRGTVRMRGELALRFDYGHIVPWVRHDERGIHAVAGPDAAYLVTEAPLRGERMHTVSDFTVTAGERVPFVLTWSPSHLRRPRSVNPEAVLASTEEFWLGWSAKCRITGPHRDAVQRSLITLKALTFAPTGGIVAAVTTSLPEEIGGTRNWDYRFCWLRDATLTLQALLAAGYTEEAGAWRDWLLRAVAGDPADLQIMYGLHGERRLPELELPWLKGYENSAPVRTGNGAAGQLQLDVWGEVLDCLSLTRNSLLKHTDDAWDVQVALMEHLETAWSQPDNGLWEMRGPQRHFTHSKVMAWVAADRMVKGVRDFGLIGPADRWEELRDTIHAEVMANGFDAERNTFVQSYGRPELDASLLLLPRVGFLAPDDPRIIGTIDAVQRELTHDGFLRRYLPAQSDDGLPGEEGVFLACSFWLVEALIGAGRRHEAGELFERLLALRNDVGLLSEEWGVDAGRQLGNTPQAFSHFALVMSALELHEDGIRRSDTPPPGAAGTPPRPGRSPRPRPAPRR